MHTGLLPRRRIQNDDTPEQTRSTLAGLIELALLLSGIAILLALLIGYVTFGRFLSYEVVWIGILLSCFYLLSCLTSDGCEALFSTSNACGRRVQSTLDIDERYLSQVASLLAALLKSALVLLLIFSLLNGTIASASPTEMLQKAIAFWGGKGLEKLNIVPSQLVAAVIPLVGGIYVLRSVKRWLDQDFLPKTSMDQGMRVSIVTLFTNVGYVLILLLVLSVMGVQWNKLAWIVSALSVGIGFGLQEIVKNFISAEGRLRRSFLATAIALTTLLAIVLAFNFIALAFSRADAADSDVREYISRLVQLSITSGLIAGLGRAFLSTRRPTWRLANINHDVALALKPFPTIIAAAPLPVISACLQKKRLKVKGSLPVRPVTVSFIASRKWPSSVAVTRPLKKPFTCRTSRPKCT